MFALVVTTCLMGSFLQPDADGVFGYGDCSVYVSREFTYPTYAQCSVGIEEALQFAPAAGHRTFVFCIDLADMLAGEAHHG